MGYERYYCKCLSPKSKCRRPFVKTPPASKATLSSCAFSLPLCHKVFQYRRVAITRWLLRIISTHASLYCAYLLFLNTAPRKLLAGTGTALPNSAKYANAHSFILSFTGISSGLARFCITAFCHFLKGSLSAEQPLILKMIHIAEEYIAANIRYIILISYFYFRLH